MAFRGRGFSKAKKNMVDCGLGLGSAPKPKTKKKAAPKPKPLMYNLIECGSSTPTLEELRRRPCLTIISIDPGKKNLGFRIERRYADPDNSIYYKKVQTVVTERILTRYKTEPSGLVHIYGDINRYLDTHRDLYGSCDILIVERQLVVARQEIIQIQQHVITYFMLVAPQLLIVDVDSHLKGQVLGFPGGDLKKWSVEVGTAMMYRRQDSLGLATLRRYKTKLDDLTDTLIQIEAVCRHLGLPFEAPMNYDSFEIVED